MIRSMTGFARAERAAPWGSVAWELRSVNHRYLEISQKLPEDLRALEPRFRQRVAARLKRGKVDCALRVKWESVGDRELTLDFDLAERIAAAAAALRARIGELAMPGTIDLLRWPGVVREQERDLDPVAELAMAALGEALEELQSARRREGERLSAALQERCEAVDVLVGQVREELPAIQSGLRARLLERLASLDVAFEPQRLEQELAIQLSKMDVDEEIDRLASHIAEVRRILAAAEEEGQGRRLDFLMQEFNREANTLGSKSVAPETSGIAVELKVLIEQMREQVQNIE
jgi:uncharacterized protein (TIGR00255 family)